MTPYFLKSPLYFLGHNPYLTSPKKSLEWSGEWMIKASETLDSQGWTVIDGPARPSPMALMSHKIDKNLYAFTSFPSKKLSKNPHPLFLGLVEDGKVKPWFFPLISLREDTLTSCYDLLKSKSEDLISYINETPKPALTRKEVNNGHPISPFLPLVMNPRLSKLIEQSNGASHLAQALSIALNMPVDALSLYASTYNTNFPNYLKQGQCQFHFSSTYLNNSKYSLLKADFYREVYAQLLKRYIDIPDWEWWAMKKEKSNPNFNTPFKFKAKPSLIYTQKIFKETSSHHQMMMHKMGKDIKDLLEERKMDGYHPETFTS